MLRERRRQVAIYYVKRHELQEIADMLGVSLNTVWRDVQYIKRDSQKTLHSLAKDELPFYFDMAMLGVSEVIREAWQIFHAATDDNVKLRALRTAGLFEAEHYQMLRSGKGVLSASMIRDEMEELRKEAEEWKARTLAEHSRR